MILFIAAGVYCALSVGKVRVSSDLTAFLPAETETRRGLTIMQEEFTTYASAEIMVSNITYETAERLSDAIAGIDMVSSVGFDDSPSHYHNAAALYSVSFAGNEAGSLSGHADDPGVLAAMDRLRVACDAMEGIVSTEAWPMPTYNKILFYC